MESRTIIEASLSDLKELIAEPIRKEVKAELRARFNQRIVDTNAVAMLHGVERRTVIAYAESGDIESMERTSAEGHYKFRLGDAIFFDFKELRRKLRNKL